jgi:sec-independent protein translocase protein TatA
MIEAFTSSGVLAALGLPGGAEWILILAFGLLIFGKRLPEVGRSLGKGIVEFKKGLKGVEDDVEEASSQPDRKIESRPAQSLPGDHKFDPYTGKPIEVAQAQPQTGHKFDPYTGKPIDQAADAAH